MTADAEFAVATGQSTEKAKVEGLRSKLKLLAARGWLAAELAGPAVAGLTAAGLER